MEQARGFFMNSLNVEDATSSTDQAPKAMAAAAILTNNQEVDKPLEIQTNVTINKYNEKPAQTSTGGVRRRPFPKESHIPPDAQELIGLIICKECGGVSYIGTVVEYNVQRNWFRIEYDDEGSEDMEEHDVLRLMATAAQIEQHIKRRRESGKRKRSYASTPKRAKSKRNASRKKADAANYVPLAYTSSKKDDYLWY